jgi:hypothetical protein
MPLKVFFFLFSGIPRWMPLELMRLTFVTLLKGKWLLGIVLSHKLLSLDRCPVSGSLVGIPAGCQLMVLVHLGVLSRQENRCVLTYLWYMCYSKDLISLIGVWDCAQKPHSLSNDQAKMGCITSTCNRAEQAFPLSNLGAQVFLGASSLPRSFVFYPDYRPPG